VRMKINQKLREVSQYEITNRIELSDKLLDYGTLYFLGGEITIDSRAGRLCYSGTGNNSRRGIRSNYRGRRSDRARVRNGVSAPV
jgi:hypothetical protein